MISFNIHEITINPNNTIFLTLCSGLFGAVLGGLISGGITFGAMTTIDNENKKRWLKDGYLKRKIDLEMQLRKYLLEVHGYCLSELNTQGIQSLLGKKLAEEDVSLILEFNKKFEKLFEYLSAVESERSSSFVNSDTRIMTLINEYKIFNPKCKNYFDVFAENLGIISDIKTLYAHDNSSSTANKFYPMNLDTIKQNVERLEQMINCYVNFKSSIENILNCIEENFL